MSEIKITRNGVTINFVTGTSKKGNNTFNARVDNNAKLDKKAAIKWLGDDFMHFFFKSLNQQLKLSLGTTVETRKGIDEIVQNWQDGSLFGAPRSGGSKRAASRELSKALSAEQLAALVAKAQAGQLDDLLK